MTAKTRKTGQDPDAHVFYDVDWVDWLTARGFLADGSEIVSAVFTVASPATKTFEALLGPVARVWVNGVPENADILVTCTLTMPKPDPGAPNVTDQFSFTIKGREN